MLIMYFYIRIDAQHLYTCVPTINDMMSPGKWTSTFFSRRVAQQQGRIHLPETWQTSGAHWPVLLWNEPIVGPDRTCSSRGCSQSQKARPPTKAVDDAIDLSSVFYWVTTLWLQKTSHELHDRQTGSFFKRIRHQNTRIVRRHVEMGLSIFTNLDSFMIPFCHILLSKKCR